MKTDRELLELAAKAAGRTVKRVTNTGVVAMEAGYESEPLYWNPLTDDGDALRLAIKLVIEVRYKAISVIATSDLMPFSFVSENLEDDPSAATRRAITRAAAEIGERMK